MSSEKHLALILDAPMQSWGFASRFQRRTTGMHPTKSGLLGMICAAMGVPKGSPLEGETLPWLSALSMTTLVIPRHHPRRPEQALPILRLEDFHTVGGGYDSKTQSQFMTKTASGKTNPNPVVSRRQYLLEARFGVIFKGEGDFVSKIATALQNPVWGIWFGRKSCIPAEPVCRGVYDTESEALKVLIGDRSVESFTRQTDVSSFEDGTDSYSDVPESFGSRKFTSRRIRLDIKTVTDSEI